MTKEKGFPKYLWVVMMVLSILFLLWTLPLLLLSGGTIIIEQGLKYAGSEFVVADVEPAALGYFNMSMLKPLWEELWIGFLGIYLAATLRQGKRFAWWLSLFWGIMLITNAAIQGFYEIVILNWSQACLQTYLFLGLGIVTLVSLMIARKRFFAFSLRPS
jgi:hypothetical protein